MRWPFRKPSGSIPTRASDRILGSLEEALKPWVPPIRRTPLGLEFPNLGGTVRIHVDPTVRPVDGGSPIVAVARVDADVSPPGVPAGAEPIAAINRLAALSALIGGKDRARLASRITFFEGEVEAERLYVLLLRGAAMAARGVLVDALEGAPAGAPRTVQGLTGDLHPWRPADFAAVSEFFRSRGLLATSGAGLTVEFPSQGAAAGPATSLLTIEAADAPADGHPLLGTGLGARLTLPISAGPRAAQLAADLNATELELADGVPFLGAWCTDSRMDALVFTSFWPAGLYYPGLSHNIGVWMAGRASFAAAYLAKRKGR